MTLSLNAGTGAGSSGFIRPLPPPAAVPALPHDVHATHDPHAHAAVPTGDQAHPERQEHG